MRAWELAVDKTSRQHVDLVDVYRPPAPVLDLQFPEQQWILFR
jgi:hypothetical protein